MMKRSAVGGSVGCGMSVIIEAGTLFADIVGTKMAIIEKREIF